MRILTLAALVMGLTVQIGAVCQEQKVIYLDGVASSALNGDTDPAVTKDGKKARDQEALPLLLKDGWRIESMHPTSDGKAFVVLIAPARLRR